MCKIYIGLRNCKYRTINVLQSEEDYKNNTENNIDNISYINIYIQLVVVVNTINYCKYNPDYREGNFLIDKEVS